jgi:hypothetical protein
MTANTDWRTVSNVNAFFAGSSNDANNRVSAKAKFFANDARRLPLVPHLYYGLITLFERVNHLDVRLDTSPAIAA